MRCTNSARYLDRLIAHLLYLIKLKLHPSAVLTIQHQHLSASDKASSSVCAAQELLYIIESLNASGRPALEACSDVLGSGWLCFTRYTDL